MNRISKRTGVQCRSFRPATLPIGVGLLGATLPTSTTSWAQEKNAPNTTPLPIGPILVPKEPAPRSRTFAISLHNVTASQMAFWLDPKNHAEVAGAKQFKPRSNVVLPEGIELIIAIDPQNLLLVQATEDGFHELEAMVALMDKPERHIEIDSELWRVANTSLTPELVNLLRASDGKTASGAVLSDEIANALRKLGGTQEAQLLTAPHFVIGENLYYSWLYSVRNLPPDEKLSIPKVWRYKPEFHSDMPTIKPQPTDPEFTMPNVAKRLSKAPASVYLQIAPNVTEAGQFELSVSGLSAGEDSQYVLANDQTLFLYLPQDANTRLDSKTFLLLKPRLVRSFEAPTPAP